MFFPKPAFEWHDSLYEEGEGTKILPDVLLSNVDRVWDEMQPTDAPK